VKREGEQALRIWMDALTPKQLIFLDAIKGRLRKMGHDVFTTTRSYHDANYIVKRLGLDVTFVGSHGGAGLDQKLEASLRRSLELAELLEGRQIDLAFSFSSPEAARVAYGLGIPHYAANDSPHSVAVARLALPLSRLLFAPYLIPLAAWTRYGIASKDIRRYRAVDAAAWLKYPEKWPEPNEVEKAAKGCIVIRLEESQASYLLGGDGDAMKTVLRLKDRFPDRRILLLARYYEQEKLFAGVRGKVKVVASPFFGANVLKEASLFIGRGGTMNAEAALLGVPTISNFPGQPTYVDRFLEKEGLLVSAYNDDELIRAAEGYFGARRRARELKLSAAKLLKRMEDPAEFIAAELDAASV
jgi:predicted glycosyltransferase